MLDRMLPGFMPYIRYNTGESMHVPRYTKTPSIEIYYKDTFENEEDKQLFLEYMERTMYQFHFKVDQMKPWKEGQVL